MLFDGSRLPVQIGRISCSIELLFEVLFSFPLRYLFAIGYHAFIFSLGWPAPPVFSRHYQADLLPGTRLRQANQPQVVYNALCFGDLTRPLGRKAVLSRIP